MSQRQCLNGRNYRTGHWMLQSFSALLRVFPAKFWTRRSIQIFLRLGTISRPFAKSLRTARRWPRSSGEPFEQCRIICAFDLDDIRKKIREPREPLNIQLRQIIRSLPTGFANPIPNYAFASVKKTFIPNSLGINDLQPVWQYHRPLLRYALRCGIGGQ
jgi:hypothetical protein